jgi:hypothetical protein
MIKLFNSIDDKFKKIGFEKVEDNGFVVIYERKSVRFGFTQVLEIQHKASGRHLFHSYDKNLFDEKRIGNTSVGLTAYEMQLAVKKMKSKGWYSK